MEESNRMLGDKMNKWTMNKWTETKEKENKKRKEKKIENSRYTEAEKGKGEPNHKKIRNIIDREVTQISAYLFV